ncbi:hypothetical protein C7212DRAFT_347345 [Tuber magnatum]|uniref:Uncharacterized protein n=1 Tax=Tuber magnatum TaxID=42249 RepID=A0A317SEK5_9PEZI|nr:hypothetical protein C7212DRAFT_347345 [Tuber magnatum]
MNKSQEQTSTSASNHRQEAIKQDQRIERRFEALASMASTPKGPGPGAPPSRAPALTAPAPGTFRSPALAPGTSLVPGMAEATTTAPPLGTVTAGLVPPPWRLLAATSGSHHTHWLLESTTGYSTGHWHGPVSRYTISEPGTTPLAHLAATGGCVPGIPHGHGTSSPGCAPGPNYTGGTGRRDKTSGPKPLKKQEARCPHSDYRCNANPSREKTPDADFTIDELQQDQVFSVPTSSIEGMGRVVTYQKIEFGRSLIVGIGPNRFCKYRIRPARDYGIGHYKTNIPLVTPRPDAHGRGFALAGIAYTDKGDAGTACFESWNASNAKNLYQGQVG